MAAQRVPVEFRGLERVARVRAALAQDNPCRARRAGGDVQFWIRVYTQIDTKPDCSAASTTSAWSTTRCTSLQHHAAERERQVDQARERYGARCTASRMPQTPRCPTMIADRDLWGAESTTARLRSAIDDIRSGWARRTASARADRSGAWETHIAETWRIWGCPRSWRCCARGVLLQSGPRTRRSAPQAVAVSCARPGGVTCASTARWTMLDRSAPRGRGTAARLNYRVLGSWPLR